MAWTAPPTFAVGDVLTAANLNILSSDLTQIWGGAWVTYTVTWGVNSGGTAPVIGNGTLFGAYKQIGTLCAVHIYLSFGSTTDGGKGSWTFTLPVNPANNVEQNLLVKAYCLGATNAGNYAGFAWMPSGVLVANPYLPTSAGNCLMQAVQNVNNAGTAGTGVPAATNWPFTNGSNLLITGTYETV